MPNITLNRANLVDAIDEYIGQANAGVIVRIVADAYRARCVRESKAQSGHADAFRAIENVLRRVGTALDAAETRADGETDTTRAFVERYAEILDGMVR